MLTADHVRARRHGSKLLLLKFDDATRVRALQLAERYLALTQAQLGGTREALDEAYAAIAVHGTDRKLAAGLLKLIEDRCSFDVPEGADPAALRRKVFDQASRQRQALSDNDIFDRQALLAEVAQHHDLTAEALEGLLFADLRSAHKLLAMAPISASQLVETYHQSQAQAVLLRAIRVVVEVCCPSASALRYLFHQLKFLRLLFTIDRLKPMHYRIVIDGPYSLFAAVTKYGLQLALALPVIQSCSSYQLKAELRWGKLRTPLSFELSNHNSSARPVHAAPPDREQLQHDLAPELQTLIERFRQRNSAWQVKPCSEVFTLPGVGLCVPDLVFEQREQRKRVFFELLGYWSRAAVWKRVDLVERGLRQPLLFAVSERLRVSEAALEPDLPAALYVFKGTLQPAAIEQRLNRLIGL